MGSEFLGEEKLVLHEGLGMEANVSTTYPQHNVEFQNKSVQRNLWCSKIQNSEARIFIKGEERSGTDKLGNGGVKVGEMAK